MTLAIQPLARADADDIHLMAGEFSAYLRALGDPDSTVQHLTGARILEEGFGPDPILFGYIARQDGVAAGYLLYTRDYNADLAIRVFHVCDLFVREPARRSGIAEALMRRAGADCQAWGGKRLQWEVWRPNAAAFDFYRDFGAITDSDLVLMHKDI